MIRSRIRSIVEAIQEILQKVFRRKSENLSYYLTILIAGFLTIVSINAFIELTDSLLENRLHGYDQQIGEFIQSFQSDELTIVFRAVTEFGDRWVYVALIVLLAVYFILRHRTWKFILQTTVVLLLSTLTSVLLKKIINRSRPSLDHLVYVDTLSYPSGHTMSATAFYGFLIYLSLRYIPGRPLRYVLVTLLASLIVLIGISRIYLGVHYPTDVAAGLIGGFIWVAFSVFVFNLIGLWGRRKNHKEI